MAPLIFAVGAIAVIWSAVKSHIIYRELVDTFPPQFQDDLTSRYVFHVYALSSSTPLPLQADYMKCLWAGCVCFLCISLGLFSLGNVVFGCFCLSGFFWAVFSAIKSWKTYRENCDQTATQDGGSVDAGADWYVQRGRMMNIRTVVIRSAGDVLRLPGSRNFAALL